MGNKSRLACLLLVALLAAAVSANTLLNGFVYDDSVQVLRNRWMTDIAYIPEIFSSGVWGFYSVHSHYYRPVMHLVYMLDYHLFGMAPWGFHLVNVLTHTAVSVLVFLVVEMLLTVRGEEDAGVSLVVPFSAAATFAVHPIHTEAVAWVAGVPETTFAFFYLLSFYLYMVSRGGSGQDKKWAFRSSVAFYFISMLCKEPAVTLPVLFFAYDYVAGGRRDRAAPYVRRYAPYLLAFCVYLAMRLFALGGFAPNRPNAAVGAYEAVINVFPLFAGYLLKLAFPSNLSAFHVFHPVRSAFEPGALFPALITALFVLALYVSLRKRSVLSLGLILISVPLLPALYAPVLGKNVFAERYLYLPVAGFGLIASYLAVKAAGDKTALKRGAAACMVAALSLYALESVARNAVWRDDYALWSDTVRKAPDGAVPHDSFGVALLSKGRLDEAIAEHKEALRLGGEGTRAHTNLGNAYLVKGMLDKAALEYGLVLKEHPKDRTAHNSLGVVYGKTGRLDKAVTEFQAAIKTDPYYAEAHKNLGFAYKKMSLYDKAKAESDLALRLQTGGAP